MRLHELKRDDFPQIYGLLERSFPPEERRSYEGQEGLLQREEYKLLGVKDPSGTLHGVMAVWEFTDFVFLEHFAVEPHSRNFGLGTVMLRELKNRFPYKGICLEAELPTEELSRRRQEFYGRNGFVPRWQSYIQPSLGEGREPIALQILSTVDEKDLSFLHIRKELYTKVYGVL